MITMIFLPESPRWLLYKGRETEAKEIIRRITNADSVESSEEAQSAIAEIQEAIATEADGKSAWRDVFTWGELQYFRRILLAFGTQAMQQLTGISECSGLIAKAPIRMTDVFRYHRVLLGGHFQTIGKNERSSFPAYGWFPLHYLFRWDRRFYNTD
jgi:hypothetical protein